MTDPAPSLLDQLDASIEAALNDATETDGDPGSEDTVTIEVTSRPGWEFRYRVDQGYADISEAQMSALDPEIPGGVHRVNLGVAYVLLMCEALVLNGQDVTGSDGRPLTFNHPELMRKLGAENATDCVMKTFVKRRKAGKRTVEKFDEAAVAMLGQALGLASGWEGGRRPTTR